MQKDVALGTGSALGVTDTAPLWLSWFEYGTNDVTNAATSTTTHSYFMSSPAGSCEGTGAGAQGLCIVPVDGGFPTRIQFNFTDSVSGGAAHTIDLVNGSSNPKCPNGSFFQTGGWHWYLVAIDPANNTWAAYIDGADMVNNGSGGLGTGCITTTSINNIITNLNTSNGFWIFNNTSNRTWGQAGPSIVGQDPIVCSSASPITTTNGSHPCTGSRTIPADIRNALADCSSGSCKPLLIGATGTVPTGLRPVTYVRGGASGMLNNLGSATTTTFTATALNTGGALFDAPYGPSGVPAHQATQTWLQANQTATVTSNAITTAPGGVLPRAGQLVVIGAESSNSSATTPTGGTCPAGFTLIGPVSDTNNGQTSLVCYALNPADLSGAYTIQWTTAGTRTNAWFMAYYDNVASVDQKGSKLNGPGLTASYLTAAGLTTTAANETVLSMWFGGNANANYAPFNPASGTLSYRSLKSGSPALMMLTDEYGVANGSNPQRTATSTAGATDTAAGFTLTLVPN